VKIVNLNRKSVERIPMVNNNSLNKLIKKKTNIFLKKEQLNAKLIRNRECARNSRKRKKVYIELLESKVKSLTEELDKTKRIL
jgi:hypothetical protein